MYLTKIYLRKKNRYSNHYYNNKIRDNQKPMPTTKLKHLKAEYNSIHGKIISAWKYDGNKFTYEITVPVKAKIIIDGKTHNVNKGSYTF